MYRSAASYTICQLVLSNCERPLCRAGSQSEVLPCSVPGSPLDAGTSFSLCPYCAQRHHGACRRCLQHSKFAELQVGCAHASTVGRIAPAHGRQNDFYMHSEMISKLVERCLAL
jgi:hypothetical protein